MKKHKLQDRPAVAPALPKELEGKSFYAARSLKQNHHHLNTGLAYEQRYTLLGCWPAPDKRERGSQSGAQMHKALGLFFDLDFTDILTSDSRIQNSLRSARKWISDNNIAHIYSHSSGSKIDVSDDTKAQDIIKAWLTSWSPQEMMNLVNEHVPTVIETLKPYAGKPNIITYTGTGAHIHYWLSDVDGFTDAGKVLSPEGVTNIAMFKSWYKAVNQVLLDIHGFQFDPARCDVGTACTRDVNNINNKNSANPKKVEAVLPHLCTVTSRLSMSNIVWPANVTAKKKMSAKLRDVQGREYDRRVKRVPKHLDPLETVTYSNSKQEEVTISVEDLHAQWEALKKQGDVRNDNGDKIPCRLNWVSHGSINSICRRGDDGHLLFICDVDKYLNAEDRHVAEKNGKLVGLWVFGSSLLSELQRDEKGRVLYHGTNLLTILKGDPRTAGKIRENTRKKKIEIHSDIDVAANPGNRRKVRQAKRRKWVSLSDRHADWIGMVVIGEYFGKIPNKDNTYVAIDLVAATNGFDPVADWVETLQWDGQRRLDGEGAWLPRILGLNKSHEKWDLYSVFGRASMLGTMRYIFADDQDCVSQHTLTLMGPQRSGKSTFAETFAACDYIGADYFADQNVNLDDKTADIMAVVRGKFVMEFPENVAFSRKGDERQKNFISQKKMIGRPAYGRNIVEENRETYFISTTNHHTPFSDPTGNRRYLAIDLYKDLKTGTGYIDNSLLRDMIPQLYAEAYHRVVLGIDIPHDRKNDTRRYCGEPVEDWNLSHAESLMNEQSIKTKTSVDELKDALEEIFEETLEAGNVWVHSKILTARLDEEYGVKRVNPLKKHNLLVSLGWEPQRNGNLRGWGYVGQGPDPEPKKETTAHKKETSEWGVSPKKETSEWGVSPKKETSEWGAKLPDVNENRIKIDTMVAQTFELDLTDEERARIQKKKRVYDKSIGDQRRQKINREALMMAINDIRQKKAREET